MKKDNTNINRRQFLISSAVSVSALAAIGAGVGFLKKLHSANARTTNHLRPPGAVDEDDFIYGCIKCGLCVQICPIDAIHLAGISQGLSYGTPYIDLREQACDFSCDSLQCVETCPTAVLDFKQFEEAGGNAITEYQKTHDVSEPGFNPFKVQIRAMKEEVKMGMAKLNVNTCLAVQGKGFTGTPRGEYFKGIYRSPDGNEKKASPLRDREFKRGICDLCVTECPIGETAIIMDDTGGIFKPKVLEGCTGCGVCVMVCPTENPSIIVEPLNQESHV
ncbi:MAG: 4Fe-4S dicluster domain-containing protein [Chlorobi bacterium]|nr:4Fe-4S dicluster domain-containing protein [Chlorobiota bacterium]